MMMTTALRLPPGSLLLGDRKKVDIGEIQDAVETS